jgi:hypothetical protein
MISDTCHEFILSNSKLGVGLSGGEKYDSGVRDEGGTLSDMFCPALTKKELKEFAMS